MKFEEVLPSLRAGKRVWKKDFPQLGLQFCPIDEMIKESFCVEIFDLLYEYWESEE